MTHPVAMRPYATARIRPGWLASLACAAIVSWLLSEAAAPRVPHPHFAEMLAAARVVQSAAIVLRAEKEKRGLMPSTDIDPNRTGMIGAEFSALTTTLGDLASKRTATNPDVAAYLVRELDALKLAPGTPVVIVVSGSFVGANIAAIAATEAAGLKPVVIASLSASMFGANDPAFNWLDMHAALRARGLIQTNVTAAALGGENGVASGMDRAAVAALRASAATSAVPLVEESPLAPLIDALLAHVTRGVGEGARAGAVINVGAALIGLGTCRESYELPPGLLPAAACHDGIPGLAMRLAQAGAPMLNVINFRRLAIEHGLPFDPRPSPTPGNNVAIYSVTRGAK